MRRRQESGVWWASPHVAGFIALMPTVLGIFLIAHQLTLHDVLSGVTLPGGGTDFASSLALSKGQLPYDNFILTQPPGMSILLLPFAWGAHGGASASLTAARALTALVAIINVFLAGFTARHHGIAATFIAGVLFATFPYSFYSTASVTPEPFLVLFCLLAYSAAFTEGQLAVGGRLVLAGALIGFAMAIKPWAVVPAIALIACSAFDWRAALPRVLGGTVLGVGVPCILFFLAAPGSFIHQVIGAEFSGGAGNSITSGLSSRIGELLGLGAPIGIAKSSQIPEVVAVVLAVIVLIAVATRASSSTMLDWALLGTTAGLVVAGVLPSHLSVDYTYFLAAFGAVVIGNSVGTLLSVLSALDVGSGDVSSTVAGGATILCVALMVAVVAVATPKESDFWRTYFLQHATNDSLAIDATVPAGACVISNDPEALVLAGRFVELPTGCPYLADPGGIEKLAGSPPVTTDNTTVVAQWEQALSEARYVVIAPDGPPIPFSPSLRQYFAQNFEVIVNTNYKIYKSRSDALSVP